MKNNHNNSPSDSQGKDNHFEVQMERVFEAFFKKPKTMLMVSYETGIDRANICRYVAKFKKEDKIIVVRTGLCHISNNRADFLTTNPGWFQENEG